MTFFALPRSLPLAPVALASIVAASCAPLPPTPQQMQSSLPSVTYRYGADQDLVQANQSAAAYCTPYHGTPRAKSFTTEPDGSKRVLFECVHIATMPAPPPVASQSFNPNVVYSFRSDQELLDAVRNAQGYCQNNGMERMTSTIGTNANGQRTITFQCLPQ